MHRGSWPGGRSGLSPPAAPGFESSCARLSSPRCLTCPLGLQGVQWAVGLVVVRASWPGHPRKSKKKKIFVSNLPHYLKNSGSATVSTTKQYRREWEIKLGWPRVNKPAFQDYQGKMACLQSQTADEVQTDGMS